jgi:hypothetical protein
LGGSSFGGTGFGSNFGGNPINFNGAPRFHFTIDPKTPVKDLLPPAPPATRRTGPLLNDSLALVPEVQLQAPLPRGQSTAPLPQTEILTQPPASGMPGTSKRASTSLEQMAYLIAKLNHLNRRRPDGALEALLSHRPDLAGLPVAMGDACRTGAERSKHFADAVSLVRSVLQSPGNSKSSDKTVEKTSADAFWRHFRSVCAKHDLTIDGSNRAVAEHAAAARVAALMQMLAPESAAMRAGLARHLATIPHVDATRALARLAVFSAEAEVRQAALDGLKLRRERDYSDTLLQGLRYPWPAAARHAGEAIIKLQRTDLVPQLVAFLDEPDPRAPFIQDAGPKQVPVVRELVRINHHRNCLLCHAPGSQASSVPNAVLTAPVPLPDQSLARPSGGYQQSSSPPDIFVRVDVNYLRQDFSLLEPVADSGPWPRLQRFDFLVRTRTLSEEEAAAWRAALATGQGKVTAYQRVALGALRELTGRDAGPTAEAWRRVLSQPVAPAKPQPAAGAAVALAARQQEAYDAFHYVNVVSRWLFE